MSELPIQIRNYRLAREVAQRIRQESATYTQEWWTDDCNSPACIAGHVASLTLRKGEAIDDAMILGTDDEMIPERAERALGLDELDYRCHLFGSSPRAEWPYPYGHQYENAPTPEARAKVAADLMTRLADEAEERERREAESR